MRKQAEHRIRGAARLAGRGRVGVAALAMNAVPLAATVVLGALAWNADEPALQAMAWILFAMAFVWTVSVTLEAWRVLRRFARRASFAASRTDAGGPAEGVH